MKKPILVVMAAGMGSRYGGLKQIDPVSDQGEIILDFSLYDAMMAGFEKVIFIIKEENEADFRALIDERAGRHLQIAYAFQKLTDIPAGYQVPADRVKPWGTCHAVLSARDLIDGPTAIRISFVMVAIWWAVFSLPLAFFVKEEKGDRVSLKEAVHDGFSQIASTLRSLRNLKNTAIFLVAYWCYIDGVDTIIRMATDYGTALGFPSESLIVALLITQFVAFPSAILYNILGKRIGVRRAILIAIGAYAVIAVIGFFMTDVSQFYILACCIGLFQGGIQALSRSYYTRLIPKENTSEFYGFFNMLGKFAAIIGPFLVGIVTLITGEQRYGIVSLVILFVLGFVLLRRVDEKKASEEIEAFSKR